MTRTLVGFDTETHLIGPGAVIPKLVCASFAVQGSEPWVRSTGDADLYEQIHAVFSDPELDIVIQTASFDLTVICAAYPDLYPVVFKALEDGRIFDTEIREKLINLSTHGKLKSEFMPDGSSMPIKYHLAEMVQNYFGRDRSAEKKGEDAWRLNYRLLDGVPSAEFPAEAYVYAAQDAVDALAVYGAQEQRIAQEGACVETQDLQTFASFCLRLLTAEGVCIDPAKRAEVEEMLRQELDPAKMPLLYESGILRPEVLPRAKRVRVKDADGKPAKGPDGKALYEMSQTAGKKSSINTKLLIAHVELVCAANGIPVPKTAPSTKFPKGQTSTNGDFLESIQEHSETLRQYVHRQALQKLVSTELPRMMADRVHFDFDVLKETGRTSSYASKHYPSANGQNIDPRVKPCYVAEPGWLLCSVDYSTQELVTLAQKCVSLFGQSTLADVINRGVDTHSYLGSGLAFALDSDFRGLCDEAGLDDRWARLDAFLELKAAHCDIPGHEHKVVLGCFGCAQAAEAFGFYKHWRKFAKPVGLGLPGGLGPPTFVTYAAGQGVKTTVEQAAQLRELWHETYPEMRAYFDWVNTACVDPRNRDTDGSDLYAYRSPLGMLRSGATYCATANGAALQTPAAEASKIALINVVRACKDSSLGSCLYGCRPCNFVHDEIIVKIPDDEFAHERANEIGRIMREAMEQITPDVKVTANPSLMYRWDKGAEPAFDDRGRLVPWDLSRKEAA